MVVDRAVRAFDRGAAVARLPLLVRRVTAGGVNRAAADVHTCGGGSSLLRDHACRRRAGMETDAGFRGSTAVRAERLAQLTPTCVERLHAPERLRRRVLAVDPEDVEYNEGDRDP